MYRYWHIQCLVQKDKGSFFILLKNLHIFGGLYSWLYMACHTALFLFRNPSFSLIILISTCYFFIQNRILSLFFKKPLQLCALPHCFRNPHFFISVKFSCPMLIQYLQSLRPALMIFLFLFKSHFSCKPSSTELKNHILFYKRTFFIT